MRVPDVWPQEVVEVGVRTRQGRRIRSKYEHSVPCNGATYNITGNIRASNPDEGVVKQSIEGEEHLTVAILLKTLGYEVESTGEEVVRWTVDRDKLP